MILASLGEVANAFDLLLCDVWGVLHDGVRSHAEAARALTTFRESGAVGRRGVVLLSNAPWPFADVRAMLDRLGVPRTAYDAIVTSGDLTRELIAAHPRARVFHLGPDRLSRLFDGLDISRVEAGAADLVVCTALVNDEVETADDYRDLLLSLRDRDVPMICANPDIVVERADRLLPCAGAIAAAYAALGGNVAYAGKPHREVYDAAMTRGAAVFGAPIDRKRTLAIGDAIRTDILGAHRLELTSLLVAHGIHSAEIGEHTEQGNIEALSAWLDRQSVRPDMVIARLRW